MLNQREQCGKLIASIWIEHFPAHLHMWGRRWLPFQCNANQTSSIVPKRWLKSAQLQLNTWSLMSHPGAPWQLSACYHLDLLCINWLLSAGPLSSHPATEVAITFPVITYAPLDWLLLFWISNSLCRTLLVLSGRHPFCRLTEAGRIIHGRLQRWLKIYENVSLVKID